MSRGIKGGRTMLWSVRHLNADRCDVFLAAYLVNYRRLIGNKLQHRLLASR